MAKQKHAKPEEFHLETIRAQKKEIKQLNQRIKQLQKELGYNQNKTEKENKDFKIEHLDGCPDCGKGFLKELAVANRIIKTCNLCDYRSVKKIK